MNFKKVEKTLWFPANNKYNLTILTFILYFKLISIQFELFHTIFAFIMIYGKLIYTEYSP